MTAYLAPVAWADVATKRDIGRVEPRIDRSADQLRAEFHNGLRTQTLVILGLNASMLGVALALLR